MVLDDGSACMAGEQVANDVRGNTAVLCSHAGRDFGCALHGTIPPR